MHTAPLLRHRRIPLLTTALFAAAFTRLLCQTVTPSTASDAFPVFENYIKLSGQSAWITGDTSAFQARDRLHDNGTGGIEDYLYTKDVNKTTSLKLDGHALGGAEDYLAHFNITKEKVGSIDMGFSSFRTFYDGVGGFFPGDKRWAPLAQQDLFTDRSKLWVEATINTPNSPVFHIKYTNELRDGQKDSTIWGDTDFTGLPNNKPPISQDRKIIPSILQLDERHQSLEASMKQIVGKTTFQLTALGDWTNNMDGRFVTRFPGEVKIFPSPAATVLVNPANMNNQIVQSQYDGNKTKTMGLTGTTVTTLTDKLTLRTGIRVEDVEGNFSGFRRLVTLTPTATGPITGTPTVVATPVTTNVTTFNDLGLAGTTKVTVAAANLGLDFKATDHLNLTFAVKGEDKNSKADGTYKVVAASGTPATTLTTTPRVEGSHLSERSLTPALDVRYNGIKDVMLYASASHVYLSGTEHDTPAYSTTTITSPLIYFNDVSQDNSNYTLGANWRESSVQSFRTEVFYKDHSNGSEGFNSNVNGAAPLLNNYYVLGTQYRGIKLTSISKPLPVLAFTTRYVYQKGRMQVSSYQQSAAPVTVFGVETYDSMNSISHNIGETIDWTPINQFYVQANADLVFNVIDTVYPRAGVVPAATVSGVANVSYNANGVLQNSNNNYFTGSFLAGAVVSKRDDVQVKFTYYRANNGDSRLANLTLPYGVVATEYSASVALKHKFSANVMGNLKVGYFDSHNGTTGSNTDFHGPMAYISIEFKL